MFDPPNVSPMPPELLVPDNPVPEVMAAAGLLRVRTPNTVSLQLMHGMTIPMWDGKDVLFFLFREKNNPAANGTFPGPTVRFPRGVIFHGDTIGNGPPPHTIHWHGQEPTSYNDGVGHCSMEIGRFTYQFQPNAMGSYFYHCHRNTVQHFEFGLYGALIVDPPTAFFTSIASTDPRRGTVTLNNVPIGQVESPITPGTFEFRVQANVTNFPQFPGFVGGEIDAKDSLAMTVPYDVEAFWVFDDRDSRWSDFAPDARAFFPKHGNKPIFRADGKLVDLQDEFVLGFFNDFNADYWFVTGVNSDPTLVAGQGAVAPGPGFIGSIPPGILIPPGLNSGVGMVGQTVVPQFQTQVSINALVGQTVLVRTLDAAYDDVRLTLPFDVVIIAWDGGLWGFRPSATTIEPFCCQPTLPFGGAWPGASIFSSGRPRKWSEPNSPSRKSSETMTADSCIPSGFPL